MRHELVICTKDRPCEARQCLESVALQTERPNRVIVVDSSATEATRRAVEEVSRVTGLNTWFLHTRPGLTLQRNVGLDHLDESTDIVHFVDDDTILEPGYLQGILSGFEQLPEAGGVGGRISNLPEHQPHWHRRLFLLNSRRQGVLLRSGVNILSFTGDRPRRVGWLSGCSMSYRCRDIAGLRFDEGRAGNGVGEDVDFSARVAKRAPLMWMPTAVLEHRQSPVNREEEAAVMRRTIRHRWRLAMHGVGPVTRGAVLYGVLGQIVISLAKAGTRRSRYSLRMAVTSAVALIDIAKGLPV
jgi:GT2 family glycosyltransferase